MKKKVYKYSFHAKNGVQKHKIPVGSTILKVAAQGIEIVMWVELLHNETEPTEDRMFTLYNTGDLIDVNSKYLGTGEIDGHVFHLYERA